MRVVTAAVLTCALGCASTDESHRDDVDPAATLQDRGPTRASTEAAAATTTPAPRASDRVPPTVLLSVRSIEATEGEDGRGRTVPADAPVALELRREDGWPGRALDPVLHVGDLRFERYEQVDPFLLRYVAADGDSLPAASPVAVQWGDDASTRIDVADSVPRVPPDSAGDVSP